FLIEEPDLLLLDEPDNHLDENGKAWLEEYLRARRGSVAIISHDRYFIDRIAENIILVEDGAAEVYRGNYSELVEQMKAGAASPVDTRSVAPRSVAPRSAAFQAAATPASSRPAETPKVPVDRAEQKQRAKRMKKIDEEIAALEARIASAEGERERNELLLCSQEVFRDGERVKKIQQQQHDLGAMIDLLSGKWESLVREKEELESGALTQ
ncbi:MAG: hypothetical protein ACXW28_00060, partial [Thermoanaerobaculia bacterium]